LEKPTFEQVADWDTNKVTQYVLNEIDETISEIQDVWLEGGYTSATSDETIQLNSKALGAAQALLNLKDFVDSLSEVEYDEDEA